ALRTVVVDTRWAPAWRPRAAIVARGQQSGPPNAPLPGPPTSVRTAPPAPQRVPPPAAASRPTASPSALAAVLAGPRAPLRTATPPPSPSPLPPQPLRFTPVREGALHMVVVDPRAPAG